MWLLSPAATSPSSLQCAFSELQDRRRDLIGRGHTIWVVQISRSLQRRLATCAHRSAWILSNEVDAQPSDDGACVVFVETVEGEAVVEQSRRLVEHLTSHLEVHLRPGLGYCLCGCEELIEWRSYGAGGHGGSVSGHPRPGKRIWGRAVPTRSVIGTLE